MIVVGDWYPARSSRRQSATLTLDGAQYVLEAGSEFITGKLSDLNISQRLGKIPRTLTLPNQSVFVTNNNHY